MAKKKTVDTLENLVPIFGANRIAENKHKKLAKEAGDKIKKLQVLNKDNNTATYGGYKVTYSESESISFKDEALEFMHKHKEFTPCIKVQEYIDMDELEKLMYNGEIPKKLLVELDKYRNTKTTPKLNVEEVQE